VRALFAELHGRFVEEAGASALPRGDTLRVAYFSSVRPSARGRGVLRALWEGSVDAAAERG
jgi:GNAT superfamily N-acetyltransferase